MSTNSEGNTDSSAAGHEPVDTEVPIMDHFNPPSSGSQSSEQISDSMENGDEDEETERIHNQQHIVDHGMVHSYLPGVQRDVYPAEFLRSRHASAIMHVQDTLLCDDSDSCNANREISGIASEHQSHIINGVIQNLPILQLDAIVPFPGTTLPLRISNPMLVGYLRREIEDARTKMPAVLKTVTGTKLDTHAATGGMVKIGIVTRLSEQRRNQVMEWRMVRRRVGSNTRGTEEDNENENNSGEVPLRGGRMGRWNIHLVRLNRSFSRPVDESENEDHSDVSIADDESDQDPARYAERRRQRRRRHREESSINYGRNAAKDLLLGRIGTTATIISVHEDENALWDTRSGDDNGNDEQQPSNIIVTALIT